jgi:outer membrane lipoprotein-sorting protein
MKKLFLVITCLLAVVVINAQSLEEIVKNYTIANKLDKMSDIKTLKISANMSMMGMEMPMEMWMKNPNKIKTVTNINGQEMIQLFDGEKGYMVNPMAGSTDPVEMSETDAKQLLRNIIFENYMDKYLKSGQLSLEGEEAVNGNPAFKLKATIEGGTVMHMLIDKSSYLLVKTLMDVNNQGMAMTVESTPSDYKETDGVLLPMKTTTSAQGMEFITNFTKVEVNIPMEDSVFKIK